MNVTVFKATILHCKASTGHGTTWANEMNVGMDIVLHVHDQS